MYSTYSAADLGPELGFANDMEALKLKERARFLQDAGQFEKALPMMLQSVPQSPLEEYQKPEPPNRQSERGHRVATLGERLFYISFSVPSNSLSRWHHNCGFAHD